MKPYLIFLLAGLALLACNSTLTSPTVFVDKVLAERLGPKYIGYAPVATAPVDTVRKSDEEFVIAMKYAQVGDSARYDSVRQVALALRQTPARDSVRYAGFRHTFHSTGVKGETVLDTVYAYQDLVRKTEVFLMETPYPKAN